MSQTFQELFSDETADWLVRCACRKMWAVVKSKKSLDQVHDLRERSHGRNAAAFQSLHRTIAEGLGNSSLPRRGVRSSLRGNIVAIERWLQRLFQSFVRPWTPMTRTMAMTSLP